MAIQYSEHEVAQQSIKKRSQDTVIVLLGA